VLEEGPGRPPLHPRLAVVCASGQPHGCLSGLYAHGWPDGLQLVAWRIRTVPGTSTVEAFSGMCWRQSGSPAGALSPRGRPTPAARA
jgi:hypothetical protein